MFKVRLFSMKVVINVCIVNKFEIDNQVVVIVK